MADSSSSPTSGIGGNENKDGRLVAVPSVIMTMLLHYLSLRDLARCRSITTGWAGRVDEYIDHDATCILVPYICASSLTMVARAHRLAVLQLDHPQPMTREQILPLARIKLLQAQVVPIIIANRATLRDIHIASDGWATQFHSMALMEAIATCDTALEHLSITMPTSPVTIISELERKRIVMQYTKLGDALESLAEKRREHLRSLHLGSIDQIVVPSIRKIIGMDMPRLHSLHMIDSSMLSAVSSFTDARVYDQIAAKPSLTALSIALPSWRSMSGYLRHAAAATDGAEAEGNGDVVDDEHKSFTAMIHQLKSLVTLRLHGRTTNMRDDKWHLPKLEQLTLGGSMESLPVRQLQCEALTNVTLTLPSKYHTAFEDEVWTALVAGCPQIRTLDINVMKPCVWQHSPKLRHLTLRCEMMSADLFYHIITSASIHQLHSLYLDMNDCLVTPPEMMVDALWHQCRQLRSFQLRCSAPPKVSADHAPIQEDEYDASAYLFGGDHDGNDDAPTTTVSAGSTTNDATSSSSGGGSEAKELTSMERQFVPYRPVRDDERYHDTLRSIDINWSQWANSTSMVTMASHTSTSSSGTSSGNGGVDCRWRVHHQCAVVRR